MAEPQLFLIELNEINFDFVQRYGANGQLPALNGLIERYGLGKTFSEIESEHVEPWIQWVTAHTGKAFSEHKVFRLGDIVDSELDQIWEVLERSGVKVGALSPMNAANRLSSPAFFVPDPWTRTNVSADRSTRSLYRAISQAVSENATDRVTMQSALIILWGFFRNVPAVDWLGYARLLSKLSGRKWIKAILLDKMLADTFLSLVKRTRPHFASLFLNAGAHIQHHYMFSSSAYRGERRNPGWYVAEGEDPILEIYAAYDRIIHNILKTHPQARIVVATGLHQEPYPIETYYWRIRNHRAFFQQAGISFASVEVLMSRDFVIRFRNPEDCALAERALRTCRLMHDDAVVFETDNRGDSLFCSLVYAKELKPGVRMLLNARELDFARAVTFVAIKNGQHNSMGYLIDTGTSTATDVPLADVFDRVVKHFAPSHAG